MSAPETTILRWLHLTDLHVGYDKESQKTALQSLIVSIEQFSDGKGFDLVLLTGDLAFSGQPKEYDALKSLLIDPLRSKPLCAELSLLRRRAITIWIARSNIPQLGRVWADRGKKPSLILEKMGKLQEAHAPKHFRPIGIL